MAGQEEGEWWWVMGDSRNGQQIGCAAEKRRFRSGVLQGGGIDGEGPSFLAK